MLYIRTIRKTQSDSIRAKLFVSLSMPFNLFISSLYTLYFIILLSLDNDVLETSKRRAMFYNILSQNFIVKCFTKSLLIRVLKRDNQVHLFRRLEKCTKRLVKCEGSIEFLRLCMDVDVVPTFAQVERRKARKWRSLRRRTTLQAIPFASFKGNCARRYAMWPQLTFYQLHVTICTKTWCVPTPIRSIALSQRSLMLMNILRIFLHIVYHSSRSLSYAEVWNFLCHRRSHQLTFKPASKNCVGKSMINYQILILKN